ncbi:retrovirus-related pol polyprotein from transposon 17.6 [Tanacetum coccineum]
MLSVVLRMNEQSHYKQEKTKARSNKAKLKRDIFNSEDDKAFHWSKQATSACKELQQAMIQSPVLALPDFEEEFLIETDASGYEVRAILQQRGHPIAYLKDDATWDLLTDLKKRFPDFDIDP